MPDIQELTDKDPHITLLMMIKNEEKRIRVSLDSVKDHVNSLTIFDTGSTDRTLEIVREFAEETGIPLHLKEGEFTDFASSRNESIQFACTFPEIDYFLFLDCNDELRGGEVMRTFAREQLETENVMFLVTQQWWSGSMDSYFNIRMTKNDKRLAYRGVVHEWMGLFDDEGKTIDDKTTKAPTEFTLYQDRTQDDDKTWHRFHRDKGLLLEEYRKMPGDARTVFYLAQTCACLNDHQEAFYYYKIRSKMEGFWEEVFHSYLRLGDLAKDMNMDWHECMSWYLKAFEHSKRAEPLYKIAKHYEDTKDFSMAHMFAKKACELPFPEECVLFVEKNVYDYLRWHVMGVVAFYTGDLECGIKACERAIQVRDQEVDKSNHKFYREKIEEKMKENNQKPQRMPRNIFEQQVIQKIREKNPNLKHKQLMSRVNKAWKDYRDTGTMVE